MTSAYELAIHMACMWTVNERSAPKWQDWDNTLLKFKITSLSLI